MTLSNYTVIYKTNGQRREFYTMAHSQAHATISVRELLPSSCEIIRTYHDPSWN